MDSDSAPGRRFPDAPSYDVHRRIVETYARDLPSGNSLLDALAKGTGRGGRKAEFEFTATPYNFCEVLSVASPETAVALLDAGITTADEAVAFLEGHGLDDLVEDNHDAAEAALRCAAMPSEVLERFQHSPLSFYEDPEGFGEKLGEDLLGKLRSNKTVWAAVQERRIDLRDILQIGISRFLDAEDDEGTLCGLLAGLKSGEDHPVRAEDVSGWIERFGIGPAAPNEVKTGVYRLAVRHGGDFAAQIPRDARTMRIATALSDAAAGEKRGLDVERRLIMFGAQVLAGASRAGRMSALPNEHDLMRLVDAGVTAAQAAEGYLRGMSAAQMIAVHRDGTVPGVPDDWI
ncbi:hypothetical protein [Arthrobacter sp. QXT-31]|uniref:hypothetical protein n=1 Tax=Arthrobacter sp. QXT-31 TaxID=1357915 RepID=UPI0012FCCF0A|nr:hypothetical protein [Arthrobacter sp. QXT-31]